MKTWPSPRILNASAAALFLAGIGLLYAGFLRFAPLPLFAAVLLCVLAAIATNAHDIERLQAAAPTTIDTVRADAAPAADEPADEPTDEPADEPAEPTPPTETPPAADS